MNTRAAARPLAALAFLAAAAAPLSVRAIAAPSANTGVPYSVADDAAARPHVAGSNLVIPVRYGGGCARHTFTPVFRRQTMGPIVWLNHTVDRPDHCRAFIMEDITVPLTAEMRSMHLVWVFAPGNVHLQVPVP
jgi:hypothetical protein